MGGVLVSFICFKLKTAASLPLFVGLSQLLPALSDRRRRALKKTLLAKSNEASKMKCEELKAPGS